jgi:5-amino-6-(5-phospho-D-ribitylamino)uracil phosphatase
MQYCKEVVMKLFISDLDGTLLNTKKNISQYSLDTINRLIDNGMLFTIATARSIDTAFPLVPHLKLNLPVILNNGALIYDIKTKTYLLENFINPNICMKLISNLGKLCPMVFTADEDVNRIYYKAIYNEGQKIFVDIRINNSDKRFSKVTDFNLLDKKIITVVIFGDKEHLEEIEFMLKQDFDLTYHLTKNIYSGYYYLEICHKSANKKDATLFLLDYLGISDAACFGDSINDFALFEACNEKYAVSNAQDDLKEIATKVIDSNNDDGVARFLETVF